MIISNFKTYKKVFWIVLIASYGIVLVEILQIFLDWNLPEPLFYTAHFALFILWLIILSDMIKHKLFNKVFWILSMFILTPICLPSYLWLREKLMR